MKTFRVKTLLTGNTHDIRVIKMGTTGKPIVFHDDAERIAKEEKVRFTLSHSMNASYPAYEVIASIDGIDCSAIGFGSCPPGSGGLGAIDPVKAARCDARDNALLELLNFDWDTAELVEDDVATVTPAESNVQAEPVVVTAEAEEAVVASETNATSVAPDTTITLGGKSVTISEIGSAPLEYGRYKSAGKTFAEIFAGGGEATQWYNYICDTLAANGEYKYTGAYPDAMRKYRESQG